MRTKDDAKAADILAATLAEVKAVGLAGLSIEAVARRAGVATGTIYTYFKNKDALLNALYLDTKAKFADFVLREDGLPLRQAFSRMTTAYIDYIVQNEAEIVFMGQMANSPLVTAETRETAALGSRMAIGLLERGKAERLLKDLDSAWMMAFLTGVVHAMAPLAAKMTGAKRTAFQEQVATLCWDALKG